MSSYNKAFRALLIGSLVCVASPAWAARGFEYSYADIGYQRTEVDTSADVDFDSVLVDGSFETFDNIALRGAFRRGRIEVDGQSADLTEFRAGIRGFYNVLEKLDVFGDVIGFNAKINNGGSHTDIGTIAEAGLRYQVAKKVEIDASYRYVGGDANESFGVIGSFIKLTRNTGISVNAAFGDDDDEEYFAGIRLNF